MKLNINLIRVSNMTYEYTLGITAIMDIKVFMVCYELDRYTNIEVINIEDSL